MSNRVIFVIIAILAMSVSNPSLTVVDLDGSSTCQRRKIKKACRHSNSVQKAYGTSAKFRLKREYSKPKKYSYSDTLPGHMDF